MNEVSTKLEFEGARVAVSADEAKTRTAEILERLNCKPDIALLVAEHLVDATLCGVESHGVLRVLQYAEQLQSGYMLADVLPQLVPGEREVVDGQGGIGIPAMTLAYERGVEHAARAGISVIAVRNVGHTGRLGAYADDAAAKGFMTICMGGGNRKHWRQVAPYGGARGVLPTNPWCIGIPGGDRGPVVADIATSKIAGGWIYAARSAGGRLPESCVIDRNGNPTTDPEDYFAGGAILSAGGHKGFGLSLVAELMGEALLGPATTEMNWLVIAIDMKLQRVDSQFHAVAEEILTEVRNCPPAEGFEQVEIPGERERLHKQQCAGVLAVPEQTWEQICMLHKDLSTRKG